MGLPLDGYNWFRASQMLHAYGAESHAWDRNSVIDWFKARGASDSEAQSHADWLASVWHGFWCYRVGDAMYYIFK